MAILQEQSPTLYPLVLVPKAPDKGDCNNIDSPGVNTSPTQLDEQSDDERHHQPKRDMHYDDTPCRPVPALNKDQGRGREPPQEVREQMNTFIPEPGEPMDINGQGNVMRRHLRNQ